MTMTHTPSWTLGDYLRKAREETGLSQARFAMKIGVSRSSVIAYEAGAAIPKRPVLLAWADGSKCDYSWLTQALDPDDGGGSEQGKPSFACMTLSAAA